MSEEKLQKKRSGFSLFVINIIISALVSTVVISVYHYFFTPKIAVIDIYGYIQGIKNLYIQGKYNEENVRKKLDELEVIINQYQKKYVILPAGTVIGLNPRVKIIKVPDLPPEANVDINTIMEKLKFQMKNGNLPNIRDFR